MTQIFRKLFSPFFGHPPVGAHAALHTLGDAELHAVAGGPRIPIPK